ncbi:RHS repeat-associated protein [Algoriphagus ratkowskyi]|uniref:RHS repeat-associated core domain-containing protein n=1 Tax=Algoriphagus ratkowskyi TaxID=57028 RepID=A0A2W7RJY8_9BACT|nr:DUF6443 domain-containing protein [Algoriphagus ratkowskyi]PZX59326.1 RHS repeat-associated protein [Algoriphagus ratkowskyi]TXD77407.1 RHS repeat-associated core domain-containing protein [Algoriphagus ratkowskyi]
MKRASLIILIYQIFICGYAQQAEIVENSQINQYSNSSYLVVGSLTLKPGFTFSASQNSSFYARVINSQQPTVAQSEDYNFVRTESVNVPGIHSDDQVINLNSQDKATTFSYMDGWGRSLQTVSVQASPDKKDWIQPSYFDSKNRASRAYLPYKATSSDGRFRATAQTEQGAFYNAPPIGVSSDDKAYSTATFEDSPLERVLASSNVGNDFQSKTRTSRTIVNTSGTVRKWGIVSSLPQSTSTYAAGTLMIQENTDEKGARTRTYVDSRGRTVLSEVEATGTNWLKTYYIFNDFNELIFLITPELAAVYSPSQAQLEGLSYQYQYDLLGRQIAFKEPGKGWSYTIYDKWDRPVLVQGPDNRLRNAKEWNFIKYDIHNRPVVTGTYVTTLDIEPLSTSVEAAVTRDEIRNTNSIGYSLNRTYPTTVSSSNVLSITYYDDYSFLSNSGWDPEGKSFEYNVPTGFTNAKTTGTVKGEVTGVKSRTTESTVKWQHNVTYYDKYYQPVQTVSGHHLNGLIRNTIAYAYSGEVLEHLNEYSGSMGNHAIRYRYTYDHQRRLLDTFHKYNSEDEILLSSTSYNELGQAYLTDVHSRDNGASYFYNLEEEYTPQGWLKELDYRIPTTDEVVFNEKIGYNQDIGSGSTSRYDGMISSTVSSVNMLDIEAAFNYTYDLAGRLTDTDTKIRPIGSSTWSIPNAFDENQISYSDNGNILGLTRRLHGSSTTPVTDQLSYTYSGNQLLSVIDNAPASTKATGFNDGNTSGNDYYYSAAGNLIQDKNKGISSISYNVIDLPQNVSFSNGNTIQYTYNAGGDRFKEVRDISGQTSLTRDYVGELELENGVVKFINHPMGQLDVATGKYRYYMLDHLGNNWVVMQETADMVNSLATFEDNSYEAESQQFIDYENATRVSESLFNHTKAKDSQVAIRLAGGQGENIGIAKAIHVLLGDTVRMEAFGKYLDLNKKKMSPMLISLVNTLASSGVSAGFDGVVSAAQYSSLSENSSPFGGLLVKNSKESKAPPAYLNYIFFDKDKNYKHGGFVQLSETAREDGTNVAHERLYQEVVAEEPGYYYIYLSNDSQEPSEAFFDDFSVQVSESPFIQGTVYYSYGMIALQELREGEEETRELFQNKNWDSETGWYDFHARQYDPALGRWLAMDPQNQFASPYLGMGNNPVMMVDPDGEFAVLPILVLAAKAAIVSAGVSAASYAATTVISGQSWNWGQFAAQVGKGAAIGGLTAGAGAGFSAGLNAVGVGVQTSNFIGGALGSFTGTLAGGGMPSNPMEWMTAIGSAAMTGQVMSDANPLGLSQGYDATAKNYNLGYPNDDYYPLPSQSIEALKGFDVADWHKLFASGSNPVLAGVYGAREAFANHPVTQAGIFAAGFLLPATRIGQAARGIGNLKIPVYRVYGGGAGRLGNFWSPINPKLYGGTYRNFAGLPNNNSGAFLLRGKVRLGDINGFGLAKPLDGNFGRLVPELRIGQSWNKVIWSPRNVTRTKF